MCSIKNLPRSFRGEVCWGSKKNKLTISTCLVDVAVDGAVEPPEGEDGELRLFPLTLQTNHQSIFMPELKPWLG